MWKWVSLVIIYILRLEWVKFKTLAKKETRSDFIKVGQKIKLKCNTLSETETMVVYRSAKE